MKETLKENKKFIIIALVIIVLLLIGVTYAYLRTALEGEEEYVIRAGTLDLTMDEGNELTLESVIPLEDEEGMKLNGFTFSLTNNGNIESDYSIYLDDIALEEGEKRIPDSSIRYSLTKNEEVFMTRNMTTMGSNPNRRVDFGTIGVDETVNYTLRIWIDYNATSEEAGGKSFKGKLRVVATQPVGEEASTVLLNNIPKGNQYNDGVDTFITGEDPNNYIWYSGKLWRAVSVNNEEKTVKLVTQWNISAILYNPENNTAFAGSYMEDWLNDTSVDGFLGNLRNYENFIVTDAVWDATMDNRETESITRPNGTTTVIDTVGLLNIYEYQSSYYGITYRNSYLNNGLDWWTITPYSSTHFNVISAMGVYGTGPVSTNSVGIRPSINLKSNVKIVSGNGTLNNPYRLDGDNDTDLEGTLLNTRYSGEYIRFGSGENNLYRIVSHENGKGTKITSTEPLKNSNTFITSAFGETVTYSSTNTIGTFLNNDYLNIENSYLTNDDIAMIEDNTTWYLGKIDNGNSYKLAKYTDTNMTGYTETINSKVGLLRYGELMAGQFNRDFEKGETYNQTNLTIHYWTLTPFTSSNVWTISDSSNSRAFPSSNSLNGIKPSLNLKSNVIITSGDGTLQNPFTLELAN